MKNLSLLLCALFLVACHHENLAKKEVVSQKPAKQILSKKIENKMQKQVWYVGLAEEAAMKLAQKNGVPFRVVQRDGELLPATDDLITGRVNAEVKQGKVVSFEIEGRGVLEGARELALEYIGLTEAEAVERAQSNGQMFRVVQQDGEFLPATMDYQVGRINAVVKNGKVVSFEVEGEHDEIVLDDTQTGAYLGLTESDAEKLAKKNKVPFRVVERDGEGLPTTRDYRPGRINAAVKDGKVVSFTVEGE